MGRGRCSGRGGRAQIRKAHEKPTSNPVGGALPHKSILRSRLRFSCGPPQDRVFWRCAGGRRRADIALGLFFHLFVSSCSSRVPPTGVALRGAFGLRPVPLSMFPGQTISGEPNFAMALGPFLRGGQRSRNPFLLGQQSINGASQKQPRTSRAVFHLRVSLLILGCLDSVPPPPSAPWS